MNKVTWQSPSNIALIKYWGKESKQIPKNPSISFTLEKSFTETSVHFKKWDKNQLEIEFLFEGKENKAFAERIKTFIHSIKKYIPALEGMYLQIESKNSFPHSTGIASSASAMSALALCLVSIEQTYANTLYGFDDFYEKASFIARLGSGSAARSVYGGINLWGTTPTIKNSSNAYSIDISDTCHPVFKNYNDAVLIVSSQIKKVSSTVGHGLMNDHPYAVQKFSESYKNTEKMLDILASGDQQKFASLVEAEALSLHAMMMTSNPNFILMEANTINIINKIRQYRKVSHIQLCFTLDAGANVHLLYPQENKNEIKQFIKQELEQYCFENKWIDDKVGNGPKKIA